MNLDIAINRLSRIKSLTTAWHRVDRGYRLDIWKWHPIFQVVLLERRNRLARLIKIYALGARLLVLFGHLAHIYAIRRIPMRLAYSGALWR